MDNKITLGVIPARGGSKGVPEKNIRPVCGKPLIAYAIECGLKCPSIDQLIVSTDSRRIADIALEWGADVPFIRPSVLAEDTTPMIPVIEHAILASERHYKREVDAVVLLDPTGPLRTIKDVEDSLRLFRDTECNAVISGNNAHRSPYFNMVKMNEGYVDLVISPSRPIGRRQDSPTVYDLNTVVWVYSRTAVIKAKERIPERTLLYLVPPERALDLDTELDFLILESILSEKKI